MPAWLISFVAGFVRLAGREAYEAYKARKAREAREKKLRDSRIAAERARAEEVRLRAEREAKLAAHIAAMDESARELQAAKRKIHEAEMRAEAIAHPIDPNPYED